MGGSAARVGGTEVGRSLEERYLSVKKPGRNTNGGLPGQDMSPESSESSAASPEM